MSSTYLASGDYTTFGLPSSLDASYVTRASALIDAYTHWEGGLLQGTRKEQLRLPTGRNRLLLSYRPIVSITSADGRYGYPRRAASMEQVFPAASLYELSAIFGGPPDWESIDPTQIVIDTYSNTGEVWMPAGIYMAQYTDVRIEYIAGYETVPDAVKMACAQLILQMQNRQEGAVSQRVGDMAVRYKSDGLFTPTITSLLEPYRIKSMR